MTNTTITDIIKTGMNNPECSFYVGTFFGTIWVFKVIVILFFLFAIFKVIERLAFDPFVEWLKNKIYKKKDFKFCRSEEHVFPSTHFNSKCKKCGLRLIDVQRAMFGK